MQPEILQRKLSSSESVLLIDVRNGWEYRGGHIPGAVHAPYWKLAEVKALCAANAEKKIVICCEHGPRAWLVGAGLRLCGVVSVDYLAGHMQRWKRESRPLVKAED